MIAPSAEGKDADAKSLSAHLANHGIEVGTNVLQLKTAEEHESLRKHLEQGHYDLLVMGATRTPCGWNLSSAVLRTRFSCLQKYRSSFRTTFFFGGFEGRCKTGGEEGKEEGAGLVGGPMRKRGRQRGQDRQFAQATEARDAERKASALPCTDKARGEAGCADSKAWGEAEEG